MGSVRRAGSNAVAIPRPRKPVLQLCDVASDPREADGRLCGWKARGLVLNTISTLLRDRSLASLLVAASIGVGVVFPGLAHAAMPYVFPALFVVVLCSLSALEESPTDVLGQVKVFTWTIISWQMVLVPGIVTACCLIFEPEPHITMILLATTTAGSVFASPALVQMAGLNRRLAVRGMIISTFMMPVSLLLFGTINDVLPPDMSFLKYGRQIVIYLLVPLAAATLVWRWRRRMRPATEERAVLGLGWTSTIALMVFCLGMMSKIHAGDAIDHHDHHGELGLYLLMAVGISVVVFAGTVILFARFGRADSLTAGMLVANRNVALSFGLMSEVFPEAVMIYVAVSQFPIFLTPLLFHVWKRVQAAHRQAAMAGRGS